MADSLILVTCLIPVVLALIFGIFVGITYSVNKFKLERPLYINSRVILNDTPGMVEDWRIVYTPFRFKYYYLVRLQTGELKEVYEDEFP